MNFFRSIINTLRNIRATVATAFRPRNFILGSIISGKYTNFKHDNNPTILYLGTWQNPKNGKFYTHGINLHYLSGQELNWLLKTIYLMKRGGQIVVPRDFYYYLKANPYGLSLIKKAYRTYHSELTHFYAISPGFSNASVSSCYSVQDSRDYQISQFNEMINQSYNLYNNQPVQIARDENELQRHITEVLNTKRII